MAHSLKTALSGNGLEVQVGHPILFDREGIRQMLGIDIMTKRATVLRIHRPLEVEFLCRVREGGQIRRRRFLAHIANTHLSFPRSQTHKR